MDGQDRDGGKGGEEAGEKEQVKEGAAINTMSHSFCGGHFLTAFIKSKPNHFGPIIRSCEAPSSFTPKPPRTLKSCTLNLKWEETGPVH